MLVVICVLLVLWVIVSLVAGVAQYIKWPKPPDGLSYREYKFYYDLMQRYDIQTRRGGRVREYVAAGKKRKAIREIRTITGCSLADAKEAVEQLEVSVCRQRAM